MHPAFRKVCQWSLCAAGLVVAWPGVSSAVNTGDIIVADRRESGLIFVDHVTGAQHELSKGQPQGFGDVTTNAAGDVFAVSGSSSAVFKIDTITGAQTLITSVGFLSFPFSIDWAPDGQLYLSDSNGLIRVDPTSGAQTKVVNGSVQCFAVGGSNLGYIALIDGPQFHIYSVDLTTGTTSKISNTGLNAPMGLATDASGDVIVVDATVGRPYAILRIDPSSGATSTISSTGPIIRPWGVTLEADGTIVVTDNENLISCTPASGPSTCPGALYRVDPTTGAQTLITEKDLFHDVTGVDLYRGPSVPTPARRSSWGKLKATYR